MTTAPAALVTATARGLYCPAGDFYIDPRRAVQTAVITHGHGDHLRGGHARYILARRGAAIARARLSRRSDITALDYGAPMRLGATTVSLHPAGHILGSAQVRIEHAGEVWVVSGDYKRQADPTCEPFERLPCDVFVSESTFAQPVYRWPETAAVVRDIATWWDANRRRGLTSVLFCYALGKAQRLLAELMSVTAECVYVHGALTQLIAVYREAGIAMLPTLAATAERMREMRGALVIAPPHLARASSLGRCGEHRRALCSGWMCVPGAAERRGYDQGFVISDHADWPALVRTCLESGARRVLLTHGDAGALARHLSEQGVTASELSCPSG